MSGTYFRNFAVLSKNAPDFFELWFGAAKVGAVLVPVNFRLAPPEVWMNATIASPARSDDASKPREPSTGPSAGSDSSASGPGWVGTRDEMTAS